MEKLVKIFQPGKMGTMQLKNRIVLAPMGGMSYTTEPGGYATDELIEFYAARARGGAGFIQLSTRAFSGLGMGSGLLSIEDEEHIPNAQRFAKAIHAFGVKLSFSISQYGIRLAHVLYRIPPELRPPGARVVAPSAVPDPLIGWIPQPLTVKEIKELVETTGEAAKRGKAGGFDAVRIHGCHGYLIHQFLSPRTNKRKDEYGGSIENRCRFGCEVIRTIRKSVGADFPIIFRMHGDDFVAGGITLEEALQHARLFVEAGVDALDVTCGSIEARHWQYPTMFQPYGTITYLAAAIKKQVRVPIITTGKITPAIGERILQEGSADFVQMGRAFIADPEIAIKAKQGRLEDICPCIYCDHCHVRRKVTSGADRFCAVNPGVGRELKSTLIPALPAKKVMVIGGGPAGMEAARTLAERGHNTSLYEKSDKLGGQWKVLSSFRPEVADLTTYMSRGLQKAGVKVFLNREVTRQLVEKIKPDAIIVATGAISVTPEVPGIGGKNVVQATDVLAGTAKVGEEVVVIGGRIVGLDTAVFLAERGKKVSIVTRSKIARDISQTLRLALVNNLMQHGILTYPDSILESITDKGINILWNSSDKAEWFGARSLLFLKADTVVLATGSRSEGRLGEELNGFMSEVYTIGDCVEPRNILEAIHEGAAIGRKI